MLKDCRKHCVDPGRFLKTWVVVVGTERSERKERAKLSVWMGVVFLIVLCWDPLQSVGSISKLISCRTKAVIRISQTSRTEGMKMDSVWPPQTLAVITWVVNVMRKKKGPVKPWMTWGQADSGWSFFVKCQVT